MDDKQIKRLTKPCDNFDDLIVKCQKFLKEKGQKRSIIFRGQKKKAYVDKNNEWHWLLSTSLERACEKFGIRDYKRRLYT